MPWEPPIGHKRAKSGKKMYKDLSKFLIFVHSLKNKILSYIWGEKLMIIRFGCTGQIFHH